MVAETGHVMVDNDKVISLMEWIEKLSFYSSLPLLVLFGDESVEKKGKERKRKKEDVEG